MCPREITVRHRRGWLLVLRESIICANVRARSRHPQWQSSSFLLAVSRGAHALARRARSHCSFSTILHVADSSAEERHFAAQAACRLQARHPDPCSPRSIYAPLHRDYSCRASQVPSSTQSSPRCRASKLVAPSSSHARGAPPMLTVARGSWQASLCAFCVHLSRAVVVTSLHFMCVWRLGCARLCGSVGSRARARAARTSHAHLARSAPLFASAAQQHAPPPRGPILSERALMGEGVAFY